MTAVCGLLTADLPLEKLPGALGRDVEIRTGLELPSTIPAAAVSEAHFFTVCRLEVLHQLLHGSKPGSLTATSSWGWSSPELVSLDEEMMITISPAVSSSCGDLGVRLCLHTAPVTNLHPDHMALLGKITVQTQVS